MTDAFVEISTARCLLCSAVNRHVLAESCGQGAKFDVLWRVVFGKLIIGHADLLESEA